MIADGEYLARAYAALEDAKKKREGYRGDCEHCAFYRGGMFSRCRHPAVELVAFNLTDDYDKDRIQRCAEQRDKDSIYGPVVCGPNGVLFQSKDGKPAKAA